MVIDYSESRNKKNAQKSAFFSNITALGSRGSAHPKVAANTDLDFSSTILLNLELLVNEFIRPRYFIYYCFSIK